MKRLLSTLFLCLVAATTTLYAQQQYTLTLKTTPQGMAGFTVYTRSADDYHSNYRGQVSTLEVKAGDDVNVYVRDIPTGWKIKEWRPTEGFAEIDIRDTYNEGRKDDIYLTMPATNLTLMAVLEYNPENPDNPLPNAWYPDEGKLVIDYMNERLFNDVVGEFIPDENLNLVNSIIISGRLSSSDYNFTSYLTAEDYPSLTYVDLSRMEYYENWYISDMQERPWLHVLLPACVKGFSWGAFDGTFLDDLTLYATTPPELSYSMEDDGNGNYYKKQNVFPSTNLTVYVPEEALPLYKADPLWKDFDLQPIVEDAASLNVKIQAPDGNMKPYWGMTLQATNIKSQATRSLIIGSREEYAFTTLPKHTSYDVRLLSRSGAVVTQARNVLIDDKDARVELTNPRRPYTVQFNASNGETALNSNQFDCLWLTEDGNILLRGSQQIESILEGEKIQLIFSLTDKELKANYRERDTISITPTAPTGNATTYTVDYQIKPIPTHRLTTLVKRADGEFMGKRTATIVIHHSATGQQVRRLEFNTLAAGGALTSGEQEPLPEGEYDVTASIDGANLTTVTQHLSLYTDQTLTFSLSEAKGSTINLKWTHYGVAEEGAEADTAEKNEKNVHDAAITLRDITNGRILTDFAFAATGNNLRLKELLEPGTVVELTLGNITNAQYAPAVMTAKADAEGNLSYNVITRDYGTLLTTFDATECSRVSIRVYDAQGQLVSAGNATTTAKRFSQLPDGDYTVVMMEGSTIADAMNKMSDIKQFLLKDIDYVAQEVKVSSGLTAVAQFSTVPALSDNAHLYTDDINTRVTPKKPIINIGTYQTLSTRVVFRPEYEGRISQPKVVISLPDDADMRFIEGSVIVDNLKADYSIKDGELTIPILEKRLLRYCMVPHTAGERSISARVSFLLDGIPTEQPLPVASFTVNEADIYVYDVAASEQVDVSGTAMPQVPVTVFVNGEQAGTTTSNIYGAWNMAVTLTNTYNLASNSIYAQFTGSDGYTLQTATKEVTLDRHCIQPLNVRMSHYNQWMKAEQVVNFDVVNNTVDATAYNFYHEAEFTFEVTLNKKDSTYIDNVLLYVYMSGDQRRLLFPRYNAKTGTWIATDVFDAKGLPSQVRVYVEEHAPKVLGDQILHDRIHAYDDLADLMNSEDPELKDIFEKLNNSPEGSAEEEDAMRQLMIRNGVDPDQSMNVPTLPDTPEARAQWEAEMDALLAAFDDYDTEFNQMAAEGYFTLETTPMNELGTVFGGYNFSKLSSSTREYYEARARGEHRAAPAAGPNEEEYIVNLENGEKIYYRLHDNGYVIVIPHEDLQITCDYAAMDPEIQTSINGLRQELKNLAKLKQQAPYRASDPTFSREVARIAKEIDWWIEKINGLVGEIEAAIQMKASYGVENIDKNVKTIHKNTMAAWDKFHSSNQSWGVGAYRQAMKIKGQHSANQLEKLRLGRIKLEKLSSIWNKIGVASKLLSVLSIISDYTAFIESFEQVENLYYSVPNPCEKNQAKADALRSDIDKWGTARLVQKGTAIVSDVASFASGVTALATLIMSGGSGALVSGGEAALSFGLSTANWISNEASDYLWPKWIRDWEKQINKLKCKDSIKCPAKRLNFDNNNELGQAAAGPGGGGGGKKKGECPNDECNKTRNTKKKDGPGGCPGPPPPPPPGTTPIMDPSGYVYEAVASNRVEDALASVYYKEMYEDMYGDDQERTVLWDAEKFGQVNPMLTDQNGEYGWDVPEGLWQVRVVKDGYLPTESEWLPVPPPQLDVNLSMTQPTAPEVSRVVATEQGVELRFDKYMKPQHLTTENIFLTRDGQLLEGTIRLLDAALTPDSTRSYARSLRFEPTQPLKLNEKVRLTVKSGIESYANVGMLQDFTQEFDVESRVSQIVADSVVGIMYDSDYTLNISALPAEAAKGKKVIVESLNPTIAAISGASETDGASTEITLDANGQGSITINGNSYGTTAISLTLADDKEVQTITMVSVKDANDMVAKKPTASRINGTEVPYGGKVQLRCETPGATIYYTLDGSCPCDNPERIRYEMPITIVGKTTIKAIAIAPGYAESDVATFDYLLKADPLSITPAQSTKFKSSIYSLQGMKMKPGQQLRKGIYIQQGKKIIVR